MSRILNIADHLAQLLHQPDVQMPGGMGQRAGTDFDDDAHGIHLQNSHGTRAARME